MNELILKLRKEAAELVAAKQAAVLASEADGVTDDAKAEHFAEFDAADAKLKDVETRLARAASARDSETAATAFAAAERQPARAALPQTPFNPSPPNAGTIPARARRHGPLVAYSGPQAAEHAYQAGVWCGAVLFGSSWCKDRLADMGLRLHQDSDGPQATLNTLDNSKGGYFVPDEMDNRIVELIAERYGLFRTLAEVVPMGSDTKMQPRWTGGMTGYWIVEGQAPIRSDPSWDMIQLVARKLGAMTKITDELEEDAVVNFGDMLTNMVALNFGEKEDAAGFVGDGTAAYGGIVGLFTRLAEAGNAASLVTAAATHTTPATLTVADFDKVIGTYPNYPNANPVWLMHKQVYYASAVNLEITASGGLTPADVRGRAVPLFRGYPVQFVSTALTLTASTAGTIPVLFGDLKLSSKFGDRRTNRTLRRGYENDDFTRGVTSLIATERLDIVNHTITDPRNAALPGPVVGLKLAAS